MKLNFWQWLGLAIIVVVLVAILLDRLGRREPAEPADPPRPALVPAESSDEGAGIAAGWRACITIAAALPPCRFQPPVA